MLELSLFENKLNQLAVIIQLMFRMDAYFMPMCDVLFHILLKSNDLQLVDIAVIIIAGQNLWPKRKIQYKEIS